MRKITGIRVSFFIKLFLVCCPALSQAEVQRTYYDSGNVKEEITIENGKKNGPAVRYNVYGTIEDKRTFKDDKLVGSHRVYFKNGNLRIDSTYKGGKLDGWSKSYYWEGNLARERFYKDGLMQGIERIYTKNGKLEFEHNYINGKKDGLSTKYFKNSDAVMVASLSHYKNDQLDGKLKTYHFNGDLATEAEYKNGKLNGSLTEYARGKKENGEKIVLETGYYIDGLKDGAFNRYYESGAKLYEEYYDHGKPIGVWKKYYESGALKIHSTYNEKEGVATLIAKGYFEDGVLKSETFYKSDDINSNGLRKTGHEKYYHSNGNLKNDSIYEDGDRQGVSRRYTRNNELKDEVNYLYEKRHGLAKYYYRNGNLHTTITYKYDRRQGPARGYYPNGKLKWEAEFDANGEESGHAYTVDGDRVEKEKGYFNRYHLPDYNDRD